MYQQRNSVITGGEKLWNIAGLSINGYYNNLYYYLLLVTYPCRKLNASEAIKLADLTTNNSRKQRPTNPVIATISLSLSSFVPKATPSVPSRSGNFTAVLLDDSTLRNPSSTQVSIGSGRFGSCSHMFF